MAGRMINNKTGAERAFATFTADDLYLFNEDTHGRMNEKFDAHLSELECVPGTCVTGRAPNAEQNTPTWLRLGPKPGDIILIAADFIPVPRHDVPIGVPHGDLWKEIVTSDAPEYGRGGQGNLRDVEVVPIPGHNQSHQLPRQLSPLRAVVFKPRSKN